MDTLLTCSHWPQQPERLSRVWGKRDLTDALAPVMQRIFVVQLSVDTMIGFRMACDTPDRLLISCPTAGCCQGSLLSTIQITLCRTVADPFDAATTDLRNNPLPCHSAAPSFGSAVIRQPRLLLPHHDGNALQHCNRLPLHLLQPSLVGGRQRRRVRFLRRHLRLRAVEVRMLGSLDDLLQVASPGTWYRGSASGY